MKNPARLVFWSAAVLFFILNILTIHDGHNWGDDFGQYIQHAKNIIQGRPYASSIMVEPWVVVPPGYPLLLAPFLKFFGVNFKILKLLNVVFWQGFVWAFYPLLRRRLGEELALLGALALLSSPYFFIFKQNVLSDVAFVFFVTTALLALTKYDEPLKEGNSQEDGPRTRLFFGTALLLMLYSFLIRPAGSALFIAAIFYMLAVRKRRKTILFIAFLFLLGIGICEIFGISRADHYMQFVRLSIKDLPLVFHQHVIYVLHMVVILYIPTKTFLSIPLFSFLSFFIAKTAPFILTGMFIIFIHRVVKRTISLMGCFFFFYILGNILWIVEGEARYFLPIMGPLMIFGIEGFRAACRFLFHGKGERLREGMIRWVLILLIANNAVSILMDLNFNDNQIYHKDAREMMQWVKENIRPEERYMFWKPRALAALTDRTGTPFWIYPEDEKNWPQRVEQFKIDYLIISKKDRYHLIQQVSDGALAAQEVWENSGYKIFKVK